jgi:SAM-dependent methyltransferase
MMEYRHTTHLVQRFEDLTYSVRRYYVDDFHFRYTAKIPKNSLVLNLGGHKEIQRGHFDIRRYDFSVIHLDISKKTKPDVQADALKVPFQPEVFDVIICSELLEHVFSPRDVIQSVAYCLKPGGYIYICTPFLFPVHQDPVDFGRYTAQYWEVLLTELGFNSIVIESQGLYFSVMVMLLKQYLKKKKPPKILDALTRRIIAKIQLWAIQHEAKPDVQGDYFVSRFTTGYGVVATKVTETNKG